MLIQVIHCHPLTESYNHALFHTIVTALEDNGHQVVATDLYREQFDPAMSADERRSYYTARYASPASQTTNGESKRLCHRRGLAARYGPKPWCRQLRKGFVSHRVPPLVVSVRLFVPALETSGLRRLHLVNLRQLRR